MGVPGRGHRINFICVLVVGVDWNRSITMGVGGEIRLKEKMFPCFQYEKIFFRVPKETLTPTQTQSLQ